MHFGDISFCLISKYAIFSLNKKRIFFTIFKLKKEKWTMIMAKFDTRKLLFICLIPAKVSNYALPYGHLIVLQNINIKLDIVMGQVRKLQCPK